MFMFWGLVLAASIVDASDAFEIASVVGLAVFTVADVLCSR